MANRKLTDLSQIGLVNNNSFVYFVDSSTSLKGTVGQIITGVGLMTTGQSGQFYAKSNPNQFCTSGNLNTLSGNLYNSSISNIVYTTGVQNITDTKNFYSTNPELKFVDTVQFTTGRIINFAGSEWDFVYYDVDGIVANAISMNIDGDNEYGAGKATNPSNSPTPQHAFFLNNYCRMVINANGVGININQNQPRYALEVSGNASITGDLFINSGTNVLGINNRITNLSGYVNNFSQKRLQTPKINFKTTGSYNLYTVPASNYYIIEGMRVITTDINTANTAPTVKFGNTSNFNAYSTGVTTSNSLYYVHFLNPFTGAVPPGTIINTTIHTASNAVSHSGVLLYEGYLLPV